MGDQSCRKDQELARKSRRCSQIGLFVCVYLRYLQFEMAGGRVYLLFFVFGR